jgi:hypothetical protein
MRFIQFDARLEMPVRPDCRALFGLRHVRRTYDRGNFRMARRRAIFEFSRKHLSHQPTRGDDFALFELQCSDSVPNEYNVTT